MLLARYFLFAFVLISVTTACSEISDSGNNETEDKKIIEQNNQPSANDIQAEFATTQIPVLLKLESIALENSRNAGTEENPSWVALYMAEVSLREDTFEIEEAEEGIRMLRPVRKAGDRFSLYGIVRSERLGHGWAHNFEPDDSIQPVIGRPMISYGPDSLVIGSPEAAAFLAQIEQQRDQEQIEQETRLAEKTAELARAAAEQQARRERIEEAVQRHNAAVAPEILRHFRMNQGTKQNFLITPEISSGRVVGTDIYTVRSNLANSVIHMGLLKPGQTGIIEITMLAEDMNSFRGSPRNGIDSFNSSSREHAYTMRLVETIDIE